MKVLAIVAHPDDEIIGCGGTLIKHKKAGDRLGLVYLGKGREKNNTQNKAKENVLKVLEPEYSKSYSFADNKFDVQGIYEIVKAIEYVREEFDPDIVYTHHPLDLNIDHYYTSRAVVTAFRPKYEKSTVEIRLIEVLSTTELSLERANGYSYSPNCYVDISNCWDEKESLLKFYCGEITQNGSTRSIELMKAKAKIRGAEIGCKLAEAFVSMQRIIR